MLQIKESKMWELKICAVCEKKPRTKAPQSQTAAQALHIHQH